MFVFCSLLYGLPNLKSSGNLRPAPTETDLLLSRVGPVPSLEILGLGLFLLLAGEETLEVAGAFLLISL